MSSSALVELVVADPVCIDQTLFKLWLQGFSAFEAAAHKKAEIFSSLEAHPTASTQRQLYRLSTCIQNECEDEFRVYSMLEKYLIDCRLLPHNALLVQLSADLHRLMTERYYEFDEPLMRLLLGRKLSYKDRKELDEIAESTSLRLSSCQRQFDNLKRVREILLDRDTNMEADKKALLASCSDNEEIVQKCFGLSPALATKYRHIIFLSRYRFDTMKKLTSCLFSDFEYFAAVMLRTWSNAKTLSTDEIDWQFFTNELKVVKSPPAEDLRSVLTQLIPADGPLDVSAFPFSFSFATPGFSSSLSSSSSSSVTVERKVSSVDLDDDKNEANDIDSDDDEAQLRAASAAQQRRANMKKGKQHHRSASSASSSSSGSFYNVSPNDDNCENGEPLEVSIPPAEQIRADRLSKMMVKFTSWFKSLTTLAATLHKNKEIRTFFVVLMDEVVQPYFVKFAFSIAEIKLFLIKLMEAWKTVSQNTKRPEDWIIWDRYMKVVSLICLVMHARASPSEQ